MMWNAIEIIIYKTKLANEFWTVLKLIDNWIKYLVFQLNK